MDSIRTVSPDVSLDVSGNGSPRRCGNAVAAWRGQREAAFAGQISRAVRVRLSFPDRDARGHRRFARPHPADRARCADGETGAGAGRTAGRPCPRPLRAGEDGTDDRRGQTQGDTMFGGDTPEITAAEVKGYLKAMQAIIAAQAEAVSADRDTTADHEVADASGDQGNAEALLIAGSAAAPPAIPEPRPRPRPKPKSIRRRFPPCITTRNLRRQSPRRQSPFPGNSPFPLRRPPQRPARPSSSIATSRTRSSRPSASTAGPLRGTRLTCPA